LRFAEEVVAEDIDEALRLIEVSKASLYEDGRNRGDQTPSSKIYHLIVAMRASGAAAVGDGSGELDLRRVRERVLAKGFTETQFEEAVDEYAMLDVSCPLDFNTLCLLLGFALVSGRRESGQQMLIRGIYRCGRLPRNRRDWCSSRLGTGIWIWAMMICSRA